jgi:hypothetical protein
MRGAVQKNAQHGTANVADTAMAVLALMRSAIRSRSTAASITSCRRSRSRTRTACMSPACAAPACRARSAPTWTPSAA